MTNLESLLTSISDALGYFCHTSKRLAKPIFEKFDHFSELYAVDEDELGRLRSKLERIKDLLKEANNFSVSDLSVKHWLRDLRDLEYCLEDVIEEIEFEMLRATTLEEFSAELMSSTCRKRKHESGLLYFSSPPCLERKIQRIWDKYHEIAHDRKVLRLEEVDGEKRPCTCPLIPTSSYPKSSLHGRKRDMEQVIEMVLSDKDDNGCNYSIIPIVGMAGVGKTTLVQHLYNNEVIAERFDLRLWVWVSQNFDVHQITSKIVDEIPNCSSCPGGLNKLHNIIRERFMGKRVLLVLDDVWIEDRESWDSLKIPLNFGVQGSKVVVTTRSKVVAKMTCPKPYRLSCLSDDDCWLVCQELFSHNHNIIENSNLLKLGMKIVSRCRGLPLAAKAVGGVLCRSVHQKHWHDVSESCLWMQEEMLNQILPAIKVSYEYLPLHLKRCFAYCALFPKDHVFYKHRLIKLWMALGFLECSGSYSPEFTGCKYFDELVERCFFQYSPMHEIDEERYIMHDLYHDLAEHVSDKECSRVEGYNLSNIERQTRHSSLIPLESHLTSGIEFDSLSCQDLRSFLFLGSIEQRPDDIPFCMSVPLGLFETFVCLRALELSNTNIQELPNSIGCLIHLRYLGLENTGIKWLPETISGLINLQSINLKHCSNLIELPRGFKLLYNLRNLELSVNSDADLWMPSGFDQLSNLQNLSLFVVGSDPTGSRIQDLGNMINLGGELVISGLDNVSDPQHAKEANLINKEKLEKLTLRWWNCNLQLSDFPKLFKSKVLQCLQPNPCLKDLTINGFCGDTFPAWLRDDYLSMLTILDLKHCDVSDKLPSLGQLPALKHLCIQSFPRLQYVGEEFCGYVEGSSWRSSPLRMAFPALETLKFKKMDAWEKWDGVQETDFPCLQYLVIDKCCKLSDLPQFPLRVDRRIRLRNNCVCEPSNHQLL